MRIVLLALLFTLLSAVSVCANASDDGSKDWSSLPPEARSSILTALGKAEGNKGYWVQQAKLTAASGKLNDGLGFSVAVSGDTVVVGVPYKGRKNGKGGKGAAYIFVKPAGGWKTTSHGVKLTASDGRNCVWSSCFFGSHVAISGNTVMVASDAYVGGGTSGAVY